MKKKLAYIDHSFHRKTGATNFLIQLLKRRYLVEVFWDESWRGSSRLDLKEIAQKDFEVVVFFQVIHYPQAELAQLRDREIVIIPMYDASPNLFDHFWRKYSDIDKVRFINFSSTLHKKLAKFGFATRYFQYFPAPAIKTPPVPSPTGLSGFLWQRTDQVTWHIVKKIAPHDSFSKFHIHGACDPPGYKLILPSEKEKTHYNIEISHWFSNRQDYLERAMKADVFFTPRRTEGIGMSFLEAMAWGKCVVAPDMPTHNEYIRHGETGFLYNPNRPKSIDFSNIKDISANTLKYIEDGHRRWLQQETELLDFIAAPLAGNGKRSRQLKMKLALYFMFKLMLYRVKRVIKYHIPPLYRLLLGIKKHIHS